MNDESLEDKAIELFQGSYNCAQSVLSVYTEYLKIDRETAIKVSCGFGAGMGRLQETCGAVTAAYMVFGLLNPDCRDDKTDTYSMIKNFHERFLQIHGTTDCKELIRCDLSTEEGQDLFKTKKLDKLVCENCIRDSIKIIKEVVIRPWPKA